MSRSYCFLTCSYAQQYGSQPVKIKNSQTDWWKVEDWTLETMRAHVGHISPFLPFPECDKGHPHRQKDVCHRIQEKKGKLIGKQWAGMKNVDLDDLNITTWDQLIDQQVRFLHRCMS